jgi:hypothetical protein
MVFVVVVKYLVVDRERGLKIFWREKPGESKMRSVTRDYHFPPSDIVTLLRNQTQRPHPLRNLLYLPKELKFVVE